MKKVLYIVMLIVLAAAAAHAGDLISAFSLTTVDGRQVEYRPGVSPLVLNVGSYWCPPCQDEAPVLEKAYQAYRDKGVRFIGVFVNSTDDDIRTFAKTYGLSFPVGRDGGVAKELGMRGMPVTFFIARDGRIVRKHMGGISYADLEQGIRAIVESR